MIPDFFDFNGAIGEVIVEGEMTIHGVTKQINAPGLLKIEGESIWSFTSLVNLEIDT